MAIVVDSMSFIKSLRNSIVVDEHQWLCKVFDVVVDVVVVDVVNLVLESECKFIKAMIKCLECDLWIKLASFQIMFFIK